MRLCAKINSLPKIFTHTEPEVLLDSKKRVGETADLPEDMVVRGLIVFEYLVQVESHYMVKEAALICRLQKKTSMLVGRRCSGTRLRVIKMPLVYISSQNS